ncbi:MAG: alpha-amylase [Phycisphaera sp.]|nr:alpha-amylase [Phycisphaera sp.]
MSSLVLYFQMHQPRRLRRYSVFDTGTDYFDDARNEAICKRVAERSYSTATAKLLDLARRHGGQFRFSIGITGILIAQLRKWAPHVLDNLAALAETGCMEIVGETFYHSLSFLYDRDEFAAQIDMHEQAVIEAFGVTPAVFRNTEMIYSNDLAKWLVGHENYKAILTEGADQVLHGKSPNRAYRPAGVDGDGAPALLLRNYPLSDDLAFRFGRCESMASPDALLGELDRLDGPLCNLFIDMESLGEHQPAGCGVFDFLERVPNSVIATADHDFRTVSEAAATITDDAPRLNVPDFISWADTERDLTAWLANAMQSNALADLYKVRPKIEAVADATEREALLADWRRLTTADHYYYMATKTTEDGFIHKYFSPYDSPYDAFINFMNVLDNLRTRLE